jgi:hypothetical protein
LEGDPRENCSQKGRCILIVRGRSVLRIHPCLHRPISVKLAGFIRHDFTIGLQSSVASGGCVSTFGFHAEPGGIVHAIFSRPADAVRARALSRPTVLPDVRRGRRRKRKKHLRGDRAHPAFLALRRMRSRVRHRRHITALAALRRATASLALVPLTIRPICLIAAATPGRNPPCTSTLVIVKGAYRRQR